MSEVEVTREDREAAWRVVMFGVNPGTIPPEGSEAYNAWVVGDSYEAKRLWPRSRQYFIEDLVFASKVIAKARMEEREACCKAIEDQLLEPTNDDDVVLAIVAEIRAGKHRKGA